MFCSAATIILTFAFFTGYCLHTFNRVIAKPRSYRAKQLAAEKAGSKDESHATTGGASHLHADNGCICNGHFLRLTGFANEVFPIALFPIVYVSTPAASKWPR